jgi:type VI secretion system secreted protein VgrG
LSAGHSLKLEESIKSNWDGEYVVERVQHDWRQTGPGTARLDARFRLLPKAVKFHPARRTPRAPVFGLHTAIVTGPAVEEIHCDEFGRIKVQFHWDRHGKFDDESSAWVRVGQMHTSGSVVIPRVGWEVLIDFEDGDPDKPVALGRVYNAIYMPPSKLPDQMTASRLQSFVSPGGKGHNEIGVDDGAGSETFNVHAQKDLNLVVANNKTEKVTNDSSIGVIGNHDLSVGANKTVQIGAADGLTVGGSQTWSVAAVRNKTVSKDESLDVKGSRSVSIGAMHMLMTPMTAEVTTTGALSETVGGLCLEVAALEVGMMTAGSTSITVGAAKIEAVAAGKTDSTIGARASTIGGALINASGKDTAVSTTKSKVTTVGGAWVANAGGDVEISAAKALDITVGAAALFNATEVILKVGDSNITLSGANVVLTSKVIKLTATGPNAELAPMVGDK